MRVEPTGITLADMNGDGALDLVVAENVTSSVAISLGNGDGTFQPPHAFAVGGLATAVAVGDFNGDGKMDVAATVYAVADGQAGDIAVLLGNGRGKLGAATLYPMGAMPSAIIARDADGDGKLDLAAISKDGNCLTTLGGNGDGTFAAGVSYTVGSQPSALAETTFGNSRALLVADFSSGAVTFLRESKSGKLNGSRSFPTGAGPGHVVLDDFNHDGVTDAAVTNGIAETVSVFLGRPMPAWPRLATMLRAIPPPKLPAATSMATATPIWSWPTSEKGMSACFLEMPTALFKTGLPLNSREPPARLPRQTQPRWQTRSRCGNN